MKYTTLIDPSSKLQNIARVDEARTHIDDNEARGNLTIVTSLHDDRANQFIEKAKTISTLNKVSHGVYCIYHTFTKLSKAKRQKIPRYLTLGSACSHRPNSEVCLCMSCECSRSPARAARESRNRKIDSFKMASTVNRNLLSFVIFVTFFMVM